MSRLSPGEREAADLFADGFDEEALMAEIRAAAVAAPDGTLVLKGFDDDGAAVDITVGSLSRVPNLRAPLGDFLAQRARAVKELSLRGEVFNLSCFVNFLVERGKATIGLADISNALLSDYKDWLDDYEKRDVTRVRKAYTTVFPSRGGGSLSVDTKRSWMIAILSALRMLRVDARWTSEVPANLDLVRGSDWATRGSRRTPVRILNRPQLKMLVRICRSEVAETTSRLRDAWAIIDGADDGSGPAVQDRELILEVARLHARFDGRPPNKDDLDELFRGREHAFPRLKRLRPGQYNAALTILYPSARLLIPFILLFAVYYRYNRSVVTTLTAAHFSEQPSPHGLRLRGMPFKNRAGKTQYASWPVTDDPHNPGAMIDLLLKWTASIRRDARPAECNHLFLARIYKGRTRSLASEHSLNLNLVRFMADHEETIGSRFTLQSLRPTVINLVHHLFDGDLLATAEAGQHRVSTLVDHYLSDGQDE